MAAPSGTTWGDIKGSYGRIGISTSISNVDLKSTVTIQVWFWSKYSVSDSNNRFFFNNNATSATSEKTGDKTIKHTVSSGSGWSTSNQTKIYTYTAEYTRTGSAVKRNCAAKFSGIDSVASGSAMYVTASYTIPALPTYTVTFDANGGSGAPSSQSKLHGSTITLSSTIPTRTGYTFLGWNSSATATEPTYSAGGEFTANLSATLYAVWLPDTFDVIFNANGGTGAPAKQTKTYDVALTLSSTIPTRTNYNFLGWSTSSNATAATYQAGGSYTANTGATLYAVWELAYTAPRVTGLSVNRCSSDGTVIDDGTYFKIAFSWATDKTVTSIVVKWKPYSSTTWTQATISASGVSGTVNSVLGAGAVSTESSYDMTLVVTDEVGSSTVTRSIPSLAYAIDFKAGGKGVSIGKPADTDNLFDVAIPTRFRKDVTIDTSVSAPEASFDEATVDTLYDKFGTKLTNGLAVYGSASDGIDPDTTLDHLVLTNVNTPVAGQFMYIKTEFYSTKSTTANRMQTAFPYKADSPPYYRYYFNGSWGDWMSMAYNAVTDAIYTFTSSTSILTGYSKEVNALVPVDGYRAPTSTTKLTFDATKHAVVVGKGVTQVLVSGSVNLRNAAAGGYRILMYYDDYVVGNIYYYKATTTYASMVFPEMMVPVSEGTLIRMYVYAPAASTSDSQKFNMGKFVVKVVG